MVRCVVNPLVRAWYVISGRMATNPLAAPVNARLYRLTRGRGFDRALGAPVVLLTTRGRKTGERRSAPVFGFADGDRVIVVASNAGRDKHPAWYVNLRADPEVEVGGRSRRMRAREAVGEERERLWALVSRCYRGYEAYREVTDRRIPVVALEPPASAQLGE